MTSLTLPEFRVKLHRATALAHSWLDRHATRPDATVLRLAFLLWRHARGNTALREALVLRGALSVARNALPLKTKFSANQ
jgi:hypothetical protein